jgi:indolepyruvate ferredoxin oxidoreductase beta subunit
MTSQLKRPRFKLLLVGVGGQGVLTAARFLGEAALHAGHEMSVGQLHGMAQRGGSVECSVLIGPGKSSYIGDGEADAVVGLEPMEVLRALPKMSENTKVLVSLGQVVPFHLAVKGETYPNVDEMLDRVRHTASALYKIDGPAVARKTGVPRTLNVVILGAVAGLDILPISEDAIWKAVERRSPSRFIDANRKAFDLGMEAILKQK